MGLPGASWGRQPSALADSRARAAAGLRAQRGDAPDGVCVAGDDLGNPPIKQNKAGLALSPAFC